MRVMVRSVLVMGVYLLLAGCASNVFDGKSPSSAAFEMLVVDDPGKFRFGIQLVSKAPFPLCLHKESWPSDSGMPYSAAPAQLEWEHGVIKSSGHSAGICIGGCDLIVVSPGNRLEGFVDYSVFGDREEVAKMQSRRLNFEVHPRKCTKEMQPSSSLEPIRPYRLPQKH